MFKFLFKTALVAALIGGVAVAFVGPDRVVRRVGVPVNLLGDATAIERLPRGDDATDEATAEEALMTECALTPRTRPTGQRGHLRPTCSPPVRCTWGRALPGVDRRSIVPQEGRHE